MSVLGNNMEETTVLAQCLDLTKRLINIGTSFKLDLQLPSGFSFNFTTIDQEPSRSRTSVVKKKSPSTIRRNAARKQKFLEDKKKASFIHEVSENSFKCDQCDHEANCKVSLRKHIGKEHKMIPQLDGMLEVETTNEKASQTEVKNVKEAEVQTESVKSNVAVKWGKSGQFPLPHGTTILKYDGGFNLDDYPIDYPVMSPPATWVLHPIWGLGKIEDDDDEHYFYRFKGNEVHTGGKKKV